MLALSDYPLLNKLKSEDNSSFEVLYKLYFPSIATYITNNNGNIADAEDIFQEAIIVLLKKVRQPDFMLTSSLKTYLFAIAKHIWLKRIRDNKLVTVASFEKYQQETVVISIEIHPEKTKEEKLSFWLTKITANCQQILKAIFFYKIPIDSLMKKLGWKNKHTAANQQYKCIQQIKKLQKKDQVN